MQTQRVAQEVEVKRELYSALLPYSGGHARNLGTGLLARVLDAHTDQRDMQQMDRGASVRKYLRDHLRVSPHPRENVFFLFTNRKSDGCLMYRIPKRNSACATDHGDCDGPWSNVASVRQHRRAILSWYCLASASFTLPSSRVISP